MSCEIAVWPDDDNPITSLVGSPSKGVTVSTPGKDEFKDDFEKYLREDTIGPLAKQVWDRCCLQ